MLNLFIAILSLIIWSSIAIYYFRSQLMQWFDNRFGKDPVLPDPDAEDGPTHQTEHSPAESGAAPVDKAS
ncbi:hypothetical protein KBX73_09480 [Acetobacter persici]|uniref:hypothetical protein n=1 Tax=Acetobacter persici TaxID=1076596 RepID=UPI0020CDD328|nr:hypothetical protein [Acetobacter persici]MCP9319996.1 hypothetical protein [Acetobacter persici]